ncbi:hypothetical protein C9374_003446 [Naegleria lovaniensis]|uniref:ADP,ATP carrier protein n=1 Tax=Naegleria lovaniensis TaxID=51637 RepID=A0AA88KLS1_NAELO|nr:uncharacterized protein C9374_003446 [Naegleria lovaniensis]KAG2385631.1 hypothetical protein C9374_003446 [Naegleria lovaniensis]
MAQQPEEVSLLDLPTSSTTNNISSGSHPSSRKLHEKIGGEDSNNTMQYDPRAGRNQTKPSEASIKISGYETMSELYQRLRKSDALYYSLAGIFSGLCTSTATQPLDTVKTRIQVFDRMNLKFPNHASTSLQSTRGFVNAFRNSKTFGMLVNIYKTEGWKALYRGLPPSLLSSCISHSLFFPIYELCRNNFSKQFGVKPWHMSVIVPSVLTAWAFSAVLVSPISLVKVRLQTASTIAMYNSETVPTTVSQVVRSIYKSEGLLGFYAGFRGVAIGASVFCLYFSLYEPLKLYCIGTLGLPYLVVVPILSPLTMIAVSTVTYPNDLIISNLQFQGKKQGAQHFNGWLDAFKSIYKSGGVRGLYAGLNTYLIRFCLGTIVTQTAYESILRVMNKR